MKLPIDLARCAVVVVVVGFVGGTPKPTPRP